MTRAERLDRWFEVYAEQLKAAHAQHGYGWPIERLPAIVAKFRALAEAGDLYQADMLAPAWKATAKHFGLKPRRADITRYLSDNETPAQGLT